MGLKENWSSRHKSKPLTLKIPALKRSITEARPPMAQVNNHKQGNQANFICYLSFAYPRHNHRTTKMLLSLQLKRPTTSTTVCPSTTPDHMDFSTNNDNRTGHTSPCHSSKEHIATILRCVIRCFSRIG